MSKKPSIDHDYHHSKDKLKISIKGYALGKKARRDVVLKLASILEQDDSKGMTPGPKRKATRK